MGDTIALSVNGRALEYVTIGRFGERGRDKALVAALALVAFVAAGLLLPRPAWAALFPSLDDVANFIVTTLTKNIFGPVIEGLYSLTKLSIANSNAMELLTKPFEELLAGGNDATKTVYVTLDNARRAVVNPLAASLLSLVMLMQLTKISQKMDSTAQMPAVKEVFRLLVFCAIWIFVVKNSTDLLKGVFELVNGIGVRYFGGQAAMATWPDSIGIDKMETFTMIMAVEMILGWGISFLVAAFSAIALDLMAMANALQLYLYVLFAPCAMCFLGFDETKQWGVGFIKGFVACSLSRLIMLVAYWMYPVLVASLTGNGTNWIFGTFADQVSIIACSLLSGFIAINSGKYAREILGG